MRISVPYRGRYKVFKVLHEEPIPRFMVSVVPSYIASVPASSFADTPSEVRELQTYPDEIWVLEYDQPIPVLFGVGVGGAEERLFKSYRSLVDLFYPPSGSTALQATLTAGTPATLTAPPTTYAQLPLMYLEEVYIANTGTSPATVTFTQVTSTATVNILRVVVPAGQTLALDRLYIPVRGALGAVSTANVDVTAVVEWEMTYPLRVAVGLGEPVYIRVVNPLPTPLNNFIITFKGTRYRVEQLSESDEPEGEIITIYPFRR
ncbi:hypothetical protein [Thermofilum sp.]|uniref:hypothetical protein n=1 Tax=Thermofilum sp. TaxID=1961369 RepID=UPI00319E80AA